MGAFAQCKNLTNIEYAGTKEEFKKIFKNNISELNYKILITCQDGKIKYKKKNDKRIDNYRLR